MNKVIATDVTGYKEATQDNDDDDSIQNKEALENNLTFFCMLLDKALKNPNDKNLKELHEYMNELENPSSLS